MDTETLLCPECGARLERCLDATGVVWQCHHSECMSVFGDDEDLPGPGAVEPAVDVSWLQQLREDDHAEAEERCGAALVENDRSCALDPGHDGDRCRPASDLCPGCGRVEGHTFGCACR